MTPRRILLALLAIALGALLLWLDLIVVNALLEARKIQRGWSP